jgi:hypothetical protein
MVEICENCKWWDFVLGDIGKCRIKSPSVAENGDAIWPVTGRQSWCGDFSPKDDRASRLLGTKFMKGEPAPNKPTVIGRIKPGDAA